MEWGKVNKSPLRSHFRLFSQDLFANCISIVSVAKVEES